MEPIALVDGTILEVHGADECAGPNCCIHNPSDHALNSAPLNWRGDRALMERICLHGVGHPDPDSLAYLAATSPIFYEQSRPDVHGCCGCCVSEPCS